MQDKRSTAQHAARLSTQRGSACSAHLVVTEEAVHLREQLQQTLLALLGAAVGETAAARLADGIDLICGAVSAAASGAACGQPMRAGQA